jgi:hypothetical protein
MSTSAGRNRIWTASPTRPAEEQRTPRSCGGAHGARRHQHGEDAERQHHDGSHERDRPLRPRDAAPVGRDLHGELIVSRHGDLDVGPAETHFGQLSARQRARGASQPSANCNDIAARARLRPHVDAAEDRHDVAVGGAAHVDRAEHGDHVADLLTFTDSQRAEQAHASARTTEVDAGLAERPRLAQRAGLGERTFRTWTLDRGRFRRRQERGAFLERQVRQPEHCVGIRAEALGDLGAGDETSVERDPPLAELDALHPNRGAARRQHEPVLERNHPPGLFNSPTQRGVHHGAPFLGAPLFRASLLPLLRLLRRRNIGRGHDQKRKRQGRTSEHRAGAMSHGRVLMRGLRVKDDRMFDEVPTSQYEEPRLPGGAGTAPGDEVEEVRHRLLLIGRGRGRLRTRVRVVGADDRQPRGARVPERRDMIARVDLVARVRA